MKADEHVGRRFKDDAGDFIRTFHARCSSLDNLDAVRLVSPHSYGSIERLSNCALPQSQPNAIIPCA